MNGLGTTELILALVLLIVLPVLAMYISLRISKVGALSRKQTIALYLSAVIGLILLEALVQIYLLLGYIALFGIVFFVSRFVAKIPLRKSLLLVISFGLTLYITVMVLSLIVFLFSAVTGRGPL